MKSLSNTDKKKVVLFRGEKWEFVRWLCRAKEDRWILVKRKDNCVTESGHECYEWEVIDCGNEEWLFSNPLNDRLFKELNDAEDKVEATKRIITDRWCGIENHD